MYTFDEKSGFYLKSNKIEKPANLQVSAHLGVKGEVRAMLWNPDGSLAHDSGWNRNLILDNFGTHADEWSPTWHTWCCIGSDGSAPATGQTSIGAFLAGTSSSVNPMPYADYPRPPVAPNYERYSIARWRFNAGEGTGTVREFTLGLLNTGGNACVRHVFPAEIPKAADQTLDVFYRITWYPDLTPRTGQVTVNGVLYDWESSFFNVDNYNTGLFTRVGISMTFNSYFKVYDGAKAGLLDNAPSGNTANSAIRSFVSQAAWERTERFTAGLDWCNTASGQIKVITVQLYTSHELQIEVLDNATGLSGIPKDNTEELTVDIKITWGRYP